MNRLTKFHTKTTPKFILKKKKNTSKKKLKPNVSQKFWKNLPEIFRFKII